ncbi:MAG: hypothetical protein AABZ06_08660, partial [Bdellovibrionota bacterium]
NFETVRIFVNDVNDIGVKDGVYTYPAGSGCDISATTSSCSGLIQKPLIEVGSSDDNQKIAGNSYKIYLMAIVPEKNIVEFQSETTQNVPGGAVVTVTKNAFAIRSTLTNAAHLESDGRVTQENPDPLAKCKGNAWGDFPIFDTQETLCKNFVQLGSGTGMAYFQGRYFGFRPADGQIIDMISASNASATSYLVGEDVKLTGGGTQEIFPKYCKDALVNVDDVTVVGKQIYFVAGQGTNAHIGFLDTGIGVSCTDASARKRICELGEKGWAQAYAGIASPSWSEELWPKPENVGDQSSATFFLKTDAGDFLTAVVISQSTGFTCAIFKDATLQQVEYKRTLGFDRAGDYKPYFAY